MTLTPSGSGVGLMSRWGFPAWARIPQVSIMSPLSRLPHVYHAGAASFSALRPEGAIQGPRYDRGLYILALINADFVVDP